MKFYNIMPFLPDNVEKMAEEYRRYSEAAGMELLLCSMTLHPEGEDPLVKVNKYSAAFGALKEKLKDSGIRNQYHCLVAGVEKPDGTLHTPDAHLPLEEGDFLWLVGEHKDIDVLMSL